MNNPNRNVYNCAFLFGFFINSSKEVLYIVGLMTQNYWHYPGGGKDTEKMAQNEHISDNVFSQNLHYLCH